MPTPAPLTPVSGPQSDVTPSGSATPPTAPPAPPSSVDPAPTPPEPSGTATAASTTQKTVKRSSGSTKTETRYRTSKDQETILHTLTDNGAGGLGPFGVVNYAGKTVSVQLVVAGSTTDGYKSDHEDAQAFEESISSPASTSTSATNSATKGGEYSDNALSESVLASSTVSVTYCTGTASEIQNTLSFKPPAVAIDLCPHTSDYVVPGSVRFTWMGQVFEDYDGLLVRGRTPTEPGWVAGQMNYSTGIATVTDYIVSGSPTAFSLDSLWTVRQNWNTASVFLRTQAAPLKPSGFVMNLSDAQGNSITAMAGIDGNITGTHLRGRIKYLTGEVELQFGDYVLDSSLSAEQKAEWWYDAGDVGAVEADKIWRPWPVDPTTLRYNSVSYFYLPIDADLLGLDPVRLPQDGRVPIFRAGSYAVVGHTAETPEATVSNGQTINCSRTRLSRARVLGSNGAVIHTGYTADLDAGTVTFTDVTGYSQPVRVEHRIEDLVRVSDVQIDGTLTFTRQLSHDFPLGSLVSSALMAGNLKARVSHLFDQYSWLGDWADNTVGDVALGTYNDTVAPVVVTNAGALTERWALIFTSSTQFRIVGEKVGQIGTGDINTETAPINPITGVPYFVLPALGWGAGWVAGNVLRINTVGAMFPLAIIRTVQAGPAAGVDYNFELLVRGDVDRPAP